MWRQIGSLASTLNMTFHLGPFLLSGQRRPQQSTRMRRQTKPIRTEASLLRQRQGEVPQQALLVRAEAGTTTACVHLPRAGAIGMAEMACRPGHLPVQRVIAPRCQKLARSSADGTALVERKEMHGAFNHPGGAISPHAVHCQVPQAISAVFGAATRVSPGGLP